MSNLKKTIMVRDGLSSEEADEIIQEARETLNDYLLHGEQEQAYDVCVEYFGLEPDYIMDLF